MYVLTNNITANAYANTTAIAYANTTATRYKADDNILAIILILWAIIASSVICAVDSYTRKY